MHGGPIVVARRMATRDRSRRRSSPPVRCFGEFFAPLPPVYIEILLLLILFINRRLVVTVYHVCVCVCACVYFSGYLANGMPPSEYVDVATGAMMTSRPMTSLPAAVGGAKCQQPMGAQFSQQVTSWIMYTGWDVKLDHF